MSCQMTLKTCRIMARVSTVLHSDDLKESPFSFRAKNGNSVNVRLVEQSDRDALQNYVRSLSQRSRYNRFLSASRELPGPELDRFLDIGRDKRFAVVATMTVDSLETIIGEACYAFSADMSSIECSLSIGDRWQALGIGTSLIRGMEHRATSMGAMRMFGDILRSNKFMIGLARKCGYTSLVSPVDWRLVRCEKKVRAA
jgi:GNAT superfamily N-acetyltransferase